MLGMLAERAMNLSLAHDVFAIIDEALIVFILKQKKWVVILSQVWVPADNGL